MKDPKMLTKLREEAAVRRNEVEHYQRALSSLIREKSLPAISQKQKNRSISATSKKTEKKISAQKERPPHLIFDNLTAEEADSKIKPTRKTAQKAPPSLNHANYVKTVAQRKVHVERSEKNSKLLQNEKKSSFESTAKQPVKHVNHLMNYEETESSAKSPDLLTPIESTEEQKKKRYSDASSNETGVTNGEYDNDSNIGALNAEYQENVNIFKSKSFNSKILQEIEDRVGSLITALRCQLLREEMIQTRVMSF